jgi:hypothetical protein
MASFLATSSRDGETSWVSMELDKSIAMTMSTPPRLISVFIIFLYGLAMARIMHNTQRDSMVFGMKLMSRTHLFCSIGAEKDKDILDFFLLFIKEEMRIMTNGKGIKYRKKGFSQSYVKIVFNFNQE